MMGNNLKKSLKIILNAYKADKLIEDDVLTLLDAMYNGGTDNVSVNPSPITITPTPPVTPWVNPNGVIYCSNISNKADYNNSINTTIAQ